MTNTTYEHRMERSPVFASFAELNALTGLDLPLSCSTFLGAALAHLRTENCNVSAPLSVVVADLSLAFKLGLYDFLYYLDGQPASLTTYRQQAGNQLLLQLNALQPSLVPAVLRHLRAAGHRGQQAVYRCCKSADAPRLKRIDLTPVLPHLSQMQRGGHDYSAIPGVLHEQQQVGGLLVAAAHHPLFANWPVYRAEKLFAALVKMRQAIVAFDSEGRVLAAAAWHQPRNTSLALTPLNWKTPDLIRGAKPVALFSALFSRDQTEWLLSEHTRRGTHPTADELRGVHA